MMLMPKRPFAKYPWGGLLCALSLPLCALAIHPALEMGMLDEWSYVRSAQTFAHSGHMVYNGWATAMLGWQLLWGALFFKAFGASFLVARVSVLVLSVLTVVLAHRSMVRLGINEWNATLATLTLALCPIMMSLSLSFMSDVPGMLAIMLCLYACVRALQAKTENGQAAWICFAALGNAVGGTARQIAWIGVLVMVPCSLWLLRRRRKVVMLGAISWVAGVVIIAGTLYWFHHQLYSVSEPLRRRRSTLAADLAHLPGNLLRPTFDLSLLLVPIFLMFIPLLWRSRRRIMRTLSVSTLAMIVIVAMVRLHWMERGWLAPFLHRRGDYLGPYGLFNLWPMHCPYPVLLSDPVRTFLSFLTFVGLCGVLFAALSNDRVQSLEVRSQTLRLEMLVLLLPATGAYVALLLPRLLVGVTLDRYLVPLIPMVLIPLVAMYQNRVRQKMPWVTFVLLAIVGSYGVAVTHDSFALYRSVLDATEEIRAAGVPRDQIDGGWEYDADSELEKSQYVHQPGVHLPKGELFELGATSNVCPIDYLVMMPDLRPRYALSFDRNACEGPAGFAPISYKRWLGQRIVTFYVVKNAVVYAPPFSDTRGLSSEGYPCWRWDPIKRQPDPGTQDSMHRSCLQ